MEDIGNFSCCGNFFCDVLITFHVFSLIDSLDIQIYPSKNKFSIIINNICRRVICAFHSEYGNVAVMEFAVDFDMS
jgi:hypothetical protein